MNARGSRYERVHCTDGAARSCTLGGDVTPGNGGILIDGQDPPFKAERQFPIEPFHQTASTSPCRHPQDPMSELRNRDHAQENAVFVCTVDPLHNARVGARLYQFRNDISVDQKGHRSSFRNPPFARSISISAPRKGDFAKNSESVPCRRVLRSHSSAETMTAVFRPRRVIVCGPFECARSITSLSRALASATLQASMRKPIQ